ncbi:MAG: hypothetical protein PSV16_07615 [Flavobacterium sp.]|nr:hypothetical protein [Flavobacterium sp.]
MRNLSLIILLFFSGFILAQGTEAVLHLKTGNSLDGYGMLSATRILGDHEIVLFRKESEKVLKEWDETQITGITLITNDKETEFRYVTMDKGTSHPQLLEIISEGEVTLYGKNVAASKAEPYTYTTADANGIESHTVYPKKIVLYIKRSSEQFPTKLTTLKGWKKEVKYYFSDCEALIKKVDEDFFTKDNVSDIVEFYNDFCTDQK